MKYSMPHTIHMRDAKYLTSVFLFFVDFILSGYDFSVLTPLYVIVTKWLLCNP